MAFLTMSRRKPWSSGEAQRARSTSPLARLLYSGWRLELAHEQLDVAADDEPALNACLAEFATHPYSHITLTRYEDDSLHVYKNEHCASSWFHTSHSMTARSSD